MGGTAKFGWGLDGPRGTATARSPGSGLQLEPTQSPT